MAYSNVIFVTMASFGMLEGISHEVTVKGEAIFHEPEKVVIVFG